MADRGDWRRQPYPGAKGSLRKTSRLLGGPRRRPVAPRAAVCACGVLLALGSSSTRAGELSELLRASLEHPSVAASQRRVEAARAGLSAERARYLGGGALFAETTRYEEQRFLGVLTPSAFADPLFSRDIARYGAFYGLPIDLAGAVSASRRAAQHELAAAQLQQRQAELLKLHDTMSSYVRLQALLRQRAVLNVQRERVEQTVERVSQQVETEQSSTAELRLAEAELARLRSDEVRLSGAVEEALAALEEASGRRQMPTSTTIVIPAWPEADTGSLLPVTLASERAEGARAQAEATRRALWPSVSAGADYTQFDGAPQSPDAWSVGLKVTVPLDPSGRRRAAAARAQAEAAARASSAALLEAQRDLTALLAAYRAARSDAEALDVEVDARGEVVRVQAELQRVGMASLEDFLRQQRDLLDAESRRTEAQARAAASWSAAQVLRGTSAERFIAGFDPADNAQIAPTGSVAPAPR